MRILIGDDHVLFREGLRRLLEQVKDGSSFREASNFDELVEMTAAPDAAYDLILTDLRMPGWPGFEGLGLLRQHQPNAKVVVVSASEAQADVRDALENGAAGYIPKSSSVKIMVSALDLIFSGGIYVPPTVLRDGPEADGRSGGVPPADPALDQLLTQRQREVLERLREGKSNKQIAHELGLSEGTVKIHMTAIFKSLGVRNRTQAAMAFPQPPQA